MTEENQVAEFHGADFMLDIETLDTAPTARISEIACVMFGPTLICGNVFHQTINPFILQDSRTIDASTMKFWTDQGLSLSRWTSAAGVLQETLSELDKWFAYMATTYSVDLSKSRIWCKGTDFDINILRNAGWTLPVKYNAIRDMRTIKKVSEKIPNSENLNPHDALSDCIAQVEDLQNIIKASQGFLSLG